MMAVANATCFDQLIDAIDIWVSYQPLTFCTFLTDDANAKVNFCRIVLWFLDSMKKSSKK